MKGLQYRFFLTRLRVLFHDSLKRRNSSRSNINLGSILKVVLQDVDKRITKIFSIKERRTRWEIILLSEAPMFVTIV